MIALWREKERESLRLDKSQDEPWNSTLSFVRTEIESNDEKKSLSTGRLSGQNLNTCTKQTKERNFVIA